MKVRKAIQGTLSHLSEGDVGSLSVPGVIILQKPRKTNLKLSNRPENIDEEEVFERLFFFFYSSYSYWPVQIFYIALSQFGDTFIIL